MEFLQYIFRFLYRIRWWLIIAPLLVALMVTLATRNMERSYPVDMTIYTGIVSGYAMETGETNVQSSTVVNNTIDNIINIILSKETLHEVSLHLYARHMIYGDPDEDNEYIRAVNYRHLQRITPPDVKKLIDKTSEDKTVENLKGYEKASPHNFVYGLFNWNHPHYSYGALSKIRVVRLGNSDMLRVFYAANDPGVAYQTLLLLDKLYAKEYQILQFGSTSNAIRYFEEELARVGKELEEGEDSLTNYNIRNRIINYNEQTKQVAALDKDLNLIYQDVLLRYNSANASIRYLETQLDENMQHLKGNAEFLTKLNRVSDLNTRVAEMEAFYTDSTSSTYTQQQLNSYKQQLGQAEKELMDFSQSFSNRKYTREGYPTSNFVTQWLEELLKLEKSKAEIQVIETHKQELDKQYSHFSPIGSTIKRQERSIDFIERNYLSILASLNAARLRLKSLEMNSASLKLINPPVFPLNAEPSKRKKLVMVAYAGSLIFLLGFFLLVDLLDRTLRDRIRTEYLTGAKVLGALPGKGKLRQRRYTKTYQEKAIQYMANGLQDYFKPGDPGPIVNVISTESGTGKSFLIDLLSDYWSNHGIKVQSVRYERDFDPASPEFLFAGSIRELVRQEVGFERTIFLVEHAPIGVYSIPKALLQEASLNLMVARADRVWKDNDKQLFVRLQQQSGTTPVLICLDRAEREVVESFTGMLPPYTYWQRLFYRYTQFGFTASGKS
ncbi:hypothetical protein [uncultured Proteiniphilum sp.]|uniref:GumC family protein n=1 Tax=uncultured Proteiniphilum sp. TaxID=497637 RepID=UPI00261A7051|nr:hypothetical protein [uncultured Proteiniphilum sp.]